MSKYYDCDINWSSIDIQDLLIETTALIEHARSLASAYATAVDFKSKYSNSSERGCSFNDPETVVEIDTNSITLQQTSNESCHCHPEYHTYTISIPIEVLTKSIRGEDWKTDVMKATIERKRLEAIAETERQRKAADRTAEEKTRRELAEFNRLNALYGKHTD